MIYGYIKTGADKFSLLLPLCCFIAIFAALSCWSQISTSIWQQENKTLLNRVTITYAIQIEAKINNILSTHQSIQRYINDHQGGLDKAEIMTSYIMEKHQEITQISFSPQGVTNLVFPRGQKNNILGRVIRSPSRVKKSVSINQPFFSQPVTGNRGDTFFTANQPIFDNKNKFWGYVSYLINITDVIKSIKNLAPSSMYDSPFSYQLSHVNDFKKLSMIAQSDRPLGQNIFQASVKVPENNWIIEVSYDSNSLSSLSKYDSVFRFLLTSVICLIIYWALLEPRRLRQSLTRRTAELADNNVLLNVILDNINEGVLLCNNSGKITLANPAANSFFGLKKNKNLDINSPELHPKGTLQSSQLDSPMHQVLFRQQETHRDITFITESKNTVSLKTQGKIIFDHQKKQIGAILLVQNVTKLKQVTNNHHSRNIILNMLANNKTIDEMFSHIINDIESQFEGTRGAILLLNNDKNKIINVIAPKLPSFFINSLNGLKIRDRAMSCGSAIFHNKMIIVEDISVHPYWIDYKNLALQAQINSCWSQPIHSENGDLLGTFDIYSNNVNTASPTQVLSLKEAATLAALAIERHHDKKQLSDTAPAL